MAKKKKKIRKKKVDAVSPRIIHVTSKHVALAQEHCADPRRCVLAQAFLDAFGDLFEEVQVGTTVTKVITSDRIIRYNTPHAVRDAIRIWDTTGKWPLPDGDYTFKPYKCSSGKPMNKDLRRVADPTRLKAARIIRTRTRHATRIDILAALTE